MHGTQPGLLVPTPRKGAFPGASFALPEVFIPQAGTGVLLCPNAAPLFLLPKPNCAAANLRARRWRAAYSRGCQAWGRSLPSLQSTKIFQLFRI